MFLEVQNNDFKRQVWFDNKKKFISVSLKRKDSRNNFRFNKQEYDSFGVFHDSNQSLIIRRVVNLVKSLQQLLLYSCH